MARPSTRGAAVPAKAEGRWTDREKAQFARAVVLHGWSAWSALAAHIPTRTTAQIKSHAQKYMKLHVGEAQKLVAAHEARRAEEAGVRQERAARGRGRARSPAPAARGRSRAARSKSKATPAKRGHSVAKPGRAAAAARTSSAKNKAAKKKRAASAAPKPAKASQPKKSASPKAAAVEATRTSLRLLKLQPRRLRSGASPKEASAPPAAPKPAEAPKRKKKSEDEAAEEAKASPSKKAKEAPSSNPTLEEAAAPPSEKATEASVPPQKGGGESPSPMELVGTPYVAGAGEGGEDSPSPETPEPYLVGTIEKGVDQGLEEFLWNLPASLPGSPVAARPVAQSSRTRRVSFASVAPALPGLPAPAPAPPMASGVDALMSPVPLKRVPLLKVTPKMWAKGETGDEAELEDAMEEDELTQLAASVTPTTTPVPWLQGASLQVPATPVNKARTFEAMRTLKASARAAAVTPSPAARPFDEGSFASTKSEAQLEIDIGKESSVVSEVTTDFLGPDWGLALEAILPKAADSKDVEEVAPTLESSEKTTLALMEAPKANAAPTLESPVPVKTANAASKDPLLALAAAAEAAPSLAAPLEARPDAKMVQGIRSKLLDAVDFNDPNEYDLQSDGLSRMPKERGLLCRIRVKGLLQAHHDSEWWKDIAAKDKVPPELELEHLVALTAVMLDLDLWHRDQADEDDVLQVGHLLSGLWLRVNFALRKDGFALLRGAGGMSSVAGRKVAIDEMVAELDAVGRGETTNGAPSPRAALYARE